MAVSLLGLMAIAMFYIITVVIGLCANRCLRREQNGTRKNQGSVANDATAGGTSPAKQTLQRESSTEVELVELLHSPPVENHSIFANTSQISSKNAMQHGGYHCNHQNSLRSPQCFATKTSSFSPMQNHHYNFSSRQSTTITADSKLNQLVRKQPIADEDSCSSSDISSFVVQLQFLPTGKFLLAERNIGVVFGSLSILAIRTGGVFSSSVAEQLFSQGLLWCQVPVAASISLILGGLLFASHLYCEGFVTLIDPFQQVYGRRLGVMMAVPILIAEILFAACVLSSLSALMELVLGLDHSFGAIASLVAVVCYLVFGGLYAATFTDAVQFVYLCLGLWTFFPFTLRHTPATESISSSFPRWLGSVNAKHSGVYVDQFVMLVLGGIPMQSYFQRILASRSSRGPGIITIVGSLGCLVNAIPAIFTAIAAASTDWNATSYGMKLDVTNASEVLHLSLSFLVPSGVGFLCVGALASGLISSCVSAILGAATILAHNVYKCWLRPKSSERSVIWVARLSIVGLSSVVLALCLAAQQLHRHWLLPYDLLYVFIFPQLFCVVYFKYANTFGALSGLLLASVARALFGMPQLGLAAVVQLPFYDSTAGVQLFPYRTLAMLVNLLSTIFVSLLCHWLYYRGTLFSSQDVILSLQQQRHDRFAATEQLQRPVEALEMDRMTVV